MTHSFVLGYSVTLLLNIKCLIDKHFEVFTYSLQGFKFVSVTITIIFTISYVISN